MALYNDKAVTLPCAKPIKTRADYEAALAEIERLWGSEENTSKGDRLDVLITLVEACEREHYPIDPPETIEAIKFHMDQMGLTRKDLEPFIGSRARVSEVLNKKRDLSLNMSRRLHEGFKIHFAEPSRKGYLTPLVVSSADRRSQREKSLE